MGSQIVQAGRIESYAIISEDGMLADATGIMPDSLKFDADQTFFEHGLDAVDVVVHGRHFHARQLRLHRDAAQLWFGKSRPSRPTRRIKRRCSGIRPVLRLSWRAVQPPPKNRYPH